MNATARVPTVPAPRAAALAPTAPFSADGARTAPRPTRPSSSSPNSSPTPSNMPCPPVVLRLEQRTDTLRIEVDDGGPAPRRRFLEPCLRPGGTRPRRSNRRRPATACGTRALPRGATHWADRPATDGTRVRGRP